MLLNIWSQIQEMNISIMKLQTAVLCLLLDTHQERHMLLGQMDLLKHKIKIFGPIWESSYMKLRKTIL